MTGTAWNVEKNEFFFWRKKIQLKFSFLKKTHFSVEFFFLQKNSYQIFQLFYEYGLIVHYICMLGFMKGIYYV